MLATKTGPDDIDQACCVATSDAAGYVLGRAGITEWALTVVAYETEGAG